jgi:small nuclear ribonucleoprotein (snRNP)-like protein
MRKLLAVVAVTALVNACATHQHSRGDPRLSDWASVMALSIEDRVEATTKDGRRVDGTVQSVDPQQIVLGPVSVILRRGDVRAVWTIPRDDSLLNGSVLGAIAGLAVGLAADGKGNSAAAITVMATGIGTVLGAWIDRGPKGPPKKLVYLAP